MINSLNSIDLKLALNLYDSGLSLSEVGKYFNITGAALRYYFKKHNFSVRNRTESQRMKSDNRLRDYNWLYDQYIIGNKTVSDISNEFNIQRCLVSIWLDRHKIKKKTKEINPVEVIKQYLSGETVSLIASKLNYSEGTIYYILNKNNIEFRNNSRKQSEIPHQLKDSEYLLHQYRVLNKSMEQIALELDVSASTVKRYLKSYGIDIKSRKEAINDGFKMGYIQPRRGADNGNFGKEASHGRGTWVTINGKDHFLRSTWELIVAKFLFFNGYNFRYEEVRFNLGDATYKPDFFIYDGNNNLVKIIEVKGWFKDEFIRKLCLFQELYPEIEIEIWDKEIVDEIKKGVA